VLEASDTPLVARIIAVVSTITDCVVTVNVTPV
jgi:hypothetical protein